MQRWAVLYYCTEVGICVCCSAPPRKALGLAQGCCREEVTVRISPGLPCGDADPRARGYGCARETLCAARRDEGARETLCACRGRRSLTAGGLHELWATPVVCSTCDGRVFQRGPRTSGDLHTNERRSLTPRSSVNQVCQVGFFRPTIWDASFLHRNLNIQHRT